jgi:hypothetical protein
MNDRMSLRREAPWPAAPVSAQGVANFYKGKTVATLMGTGPGGGFDLNGRAISDHLGRHIHSTFLSCPQSSVRRQVRHLPSLVVPLRWQRRSATSKLMPPWVRIHKARLRLQMNSRQTTEQVRDVGLSESPGPFAEWQPKSITFARPPLRRVVQPSAKYQHCASPFTSRV